MENQGKKNPFNTSKRIQALFRDGDDEGELEEVIATIEAAGIDLPKYGNIWDAYIDALYQQNHLLRAAIEAAKERCRQSASWKETINQTLMQSVGKGGCEEIERAKEFLEQEVDQKKALDEESVCKKIHLSTDQARGTDDPLEKARIKNLRKATNQMYLGQSAQDVEFMEGLLKDKRLAVGGMIPRHTVVTNREIRKLLKDALEKCSKWKKQLHERTPLYIRHRRRFLTKRAKCRTVVVHRKQKHVMNRTKARRIAGNVTKLSTECGKKLLKYIENVAYPFYSKIPEKLFPELPEFVAEVYDAAARVYIADMSAVEMWDLEHLLKKSSNVPKDKMKLRRLKNRLHFARYPTEKAYLWYNIFTISSTKLPKKPQEAAMASAMLTESAKACGSIPWCFLSSIASIHINYMLKNSLKTEIHLMEAMEIANDFPEVLPGNFYKILKQCHRNYLKSLTSDDTQRHSMH